MESLIKEKLLGYSREEETVLLPRNALFSESVAVESFWAKMTSTRFTMAYMGFLGFLLLYSIRITMSVALVSMVTSNEFTVLNDTVGYNHCPENQKVPTNTSTAFRENSGTFDWTTTEKANILSSYYYLRCFFLIPAGRLAVTQGGKHICGFGILLAGILTSLTPLAAYCGVWYVVIGRMLVGVFDAVSYPAFFHLMGQWVPKYERSSFSTLAFSGSHLGNVVAPPVAGYLCTLDLFRGWPLPFYLLGLCSVIWFAFWSYLVYESPKEHPRISFQEQAYIRANLEPDLCGNSYVVPWSDIVKSKPVFALASARFADNFFSVGLTTSLSFFLADVLNFEITSNGVLSSLPWIACFVSTLIFACLSDAVASRSLLSVTFVRKYCQAISSVVSGVFLIGAAFAGCDAMLVIVLIISASFFFGAHYAGSLSNSLDLAPNYAGILSAIGNTSASAAGFIAPFVVDLLIRSDVHSNDTWRQVFIVFAVVGWIGSSLFLLFGSGEVQIWAITSSTPPVYENI